MEDDVDPGLSELGCCLWRFKHFSSLCVQKHFAEDIHHLETNGEIYGVLSFIFWTSTLIPLLKCVYCAKSR